MLTVNSVQQRRCLACAAFFDLSLYPRGEFEVRTMVYSNLLKYCILLSSFLLYAPFHKFDIGGVAQWRRRQPPEQEIPGSSPGIF